MKPTTFKTGAVQNPTSQHPSKFVVKDVAMLLQRVEEVEPVHLETTRPVDYSATKLVRVNLRLGVD